MEGLVIHSLCPLGPPRSSVTAHYTSLVDSVKKVIVINSSSTSYEMKVLFWFGDEKGEEVLIATFLFIPVIFG